MGSCKSAVLALAVFLALGWLATSLVPAEAPRPAVPVIHEPAPDESIPGRTRRAPSFSEHAARRIPRPAVEAEMTEPASGVSPLDAPDKGR